MSLTNLELIVGEALETSDESHRKRLSAILDPSNIYDPELKEIVNCLKNPKFNFQLILVLYGERTLAYAMELANQYQKKNIKKQEQEQDND